MMILCETERLTKRIFTFVNIYHEREASVIAHNINGQWHISRRQGETLKRKLCPNRNCLCAENGLLNETPLVNPTVFKYSGGYQILPKGGV